MDPLITITDARRAGYCVRGVKDWFARHPDLDFAEFLKGGLPASKLREHGDGFVETVIERKQRP